MLSQEYKVLIKKLLSATQDNNINWSKGIGFNSFTVTPTNSSKIVIDSYYSKVDNIISNCLNFTVYSLPDNKLIDETVLCDGASDKEDYQLLSELYQTIKNQFSNKEINPLLTNITQSIS